MSQTSQTVSLCRSAGTLSSRSSPNRCRLGDACQCAACSQIAAAWPAQMAPPDRTNGPAASAGAGVCLTVLESPVAASDGREVSVSIVATPCCIARLALAAFAWPTEGARSGGQCGATHTCAPLQLPHGSPSTTVRATPCPTIETTRVVISKEAR
jgi:hypothetical protein